MGSFCQVIKNRNRNYFKGRKIKDMKLTLLVMAAGMGSRYGGLKQITRFGPNDETILDYSIYDAIKSGFTKVVFVIRKEIEEDFRNIVVKRIEPHIEVECVYQELDSFVPSDFTIPKDRKKPWGTGHAVLAAQNAIDGPFAVINADDFYGRSSYKVIADFLNKNTNESALVAYRLKKTLSAYGSVSRGVCNIDIEGNLQSIIEHTKIAMDDQGKLIDWQPNGVAVRLTGNEMVSLNLWGFQPSFFDYLKKQFHEFLKKHGNEDRSEFYLPSVVDNAIKEGLGVAVLPTTENWFGITYKEDLEIVQKQIQERIKSGEYPERLWGGLMVGK